MNYPKSPELIEKVDFKGYKNAGLYLTRFTEDDLPVLFIGNEDEQSVYVICNLNPSDMYVLQDFELAIKNYAENEGICEWLINNGYVNKAHDSYKSGWVDVPICKMTDKLIKIVTEKCQ